MKKKQDEELRRMIKIAIKYKQLLRKLE